MRRAAEYRKFADDCLQLARRLRKPEHRQRLQEMATAWEMLAVEGEAELAKEAQASNCVGIEPGDHVASGVR